jgi:hypothetical protein
MGNQTVNHRGRAVLSGLTATGTNQATAFALVSRGDHQFTTVTSSTGAVLPSARLADSGSVWNGGANTLSVYPPVGGKVNDGSVNAAYSVNAASGVVIFATDSLTWYAVAGGSSSLPSIGDKSVVGYTTGGTTTPTGVTLTAMIDEAIANTQGDVLYRSATAWSALAPGSSGQALLTQGASANPQWGNTVSSVTAGAGLNGGTITTTGTISANYGVPYAFASRSIVM